jgi:hypothetical protein
LNHWRPYDFQESYIVIEEDFYPQSEWTDLVGILHTIYRTICSYTGIADIHNEIITQNLREILLGMQELRIRCTSSGVTPFPFNEFFGE